MITLSTDGKFLLLKFPYDKELVKKIHVLIPCASWDDSRKTWILPLAIESFYKAREAFPNSFIDKSLELYDWNLNKPDLREIEYNPPNTFKPFKHQIITFQKAISFKQFPIFNTMRTGKTSTMLMVLDYLFKTGAIKKALIISPLRVMDDAWIADANRFFPYLEIKKLNKSQTEAEEGISIINWDMIKILYNYEIKKENNKTVKVTTKNFNFDFDCVILDESAKVRNVETKRFETLKRYLPVKYTYILSGLPAPNTALEYWPQYFLMDGGKTFGVNYYYFLKKHAIKEKYNWFITKDGLKNIKEKVVAKSIRYELQDCADVPKTVSLYREVLLDDKHFLKYKELLINHKTMIDEKEIDLSNIKIKTNKLQQAASGYIYAEDGNTLALSNSNKKIETLAEILEEEIGGIQVIIYAYFKNQIEHVFQHLSKIYKMSLVYGGSRANQPGIKEFKNFETQILLANPASIGHGITLPNAEGIIWFAPIYDYEIFEQARVRTLTLDQKKPKFEMFLYSHGTIEYEIYQALEHKKDVSDVILKAIKKVGKEKQYSLYY